MSPDGDWNCSEKRLACELPAKPIVAAAIAAHTPAIIPICRRTDMRDTAPFGCTADRFRCVARLQAMVTLPALDGVDHKFVDLGDGVTIHVADAGPAEGRR